MNCPRCNTTHKIIKVAKHPQDYRYECRSCLAVFLYDDGYYLQFKERGNRAVPIAWGTILAFAALMIFHFTETNPFTIIVSGLLFLFGAHQIKIGLFSDQALIDKLTLGKKHRGDQC